MLPTNKPNKRKASSPKGPKGPKGPKTKTRTRTLTPERIIHKANKNTVEVTSLMNLVPGRVTPNVEKRSSNNRRGFGKLSTLKKRSRSRSKKYSFKYRPGSVEYRKLSQQSSRTPSQEPLYAVLPPLSDNKINSILIEKPPGVTKTKKGKTKKRKRTIAPKIKELMKKFERNESAK